MAITYESQGKVRTKAREVLRGTGAYFSLKAFFLYAATQLKNKDLALLAFDSLSIDDSGGQVLGDAACTLYAVYGKKRNTATDAYLVIFDDATDDTGAGTDGRVVLPFLVGNDEAWYFCPQGVVMGTGVVAKSYTDFDGTTDSTAGDAPDGFVIVAQN